VQVDVGRDGASRPGIIDFVGIGLVDVDPA
jgi:hypothetical protein